MLQWLGKPIWFVELCKQSRLNWIFLLCGQLMTIEQAAQANDVPRLGVWCSSFRWRSLLDILLENDVIFGVSLALVGVINYMLFNAFFFNFQNYLSFFLPEVVKGLKVIQSALFFFITVDFYSGIYNRLVLIWKKFAWRINRSV